MLQWNTRTREAVYDALKGATVAIACMIVLFLFRLTQPLEDMTRDAYNRAANRLQPAGGESDIVIVHIDQAAVNWAAQSIWEARWPWSPDILHRMNRYLMKYGAKSIVYSYQQPFEPVHMDKLYEFHNDKERWTLEGEHSSISQGVYLGANGLYATWPDAESAKRVATMFPSERLALQEGYALPPAAKGDTAIVPFGTVYNNFFNIGNTMLEPDGSGAYRNARPVFQFDGKLVPTLGLAAWMAANKDGKVEVGHKKLVVNGHELPLDSRGRLMLRFDGRPIPEVSAKKLLVSTIYEGEGLEPPISDADAIFRDKYVFVRYSGTDAADSLATPIDPKSNTTAFHAQVLHNIVHGSALAAPPRLLVLVCLQLYILLTCAICLGLPRLRWFCALAVVLLAPIGLGLGLFMVGYVVPVGLFTLSGVLGAIITFGLRYFHEWQRRQVIQRTFNYYMNPVITEQLLSNPEQLELGGDEYDITILFSDLANFTSASSRKSPGEIITFLNEYLEAMSSIILDEGGCIDKYIGDAIVAFWNVPVARPDHADRAIRAALACQARILELQQEFKSKFGFDLASRIGIHTGKSIVGNVGSVKFRNYTAIGSTVNLASRLEGANKYFGTSVLVSDAARVSLTGTAEVGFLDLGTIRVVGQHDTIHVYEPILPSDKADAAQVDLFNTATAAFGDGNFAEAQELYRQCETLPASAAMQRYCQMYLDGRPWQGFIELDAK